MKHGTPKILSVEFNTKKKAEDCFKKLKERAVDIFHVEYMGKRISGYTVHYKKTS